MKMKDEKQRHNHKLTELLKICIFAILMIAPLLASVSQMLYVTLNKNAKDSYYGETINQSEYVETNTLQQNATYKLTLNNESDYSYETVLIEIDFIEGTSNQTTIQNNFDVDTPLIKYFKIESNLLRLYDKEKENIRSYYFGSTQPTREIQITFIPNLSYNYVFNQLYKLEYNKYSYLDNAFYYGVDQMTESDLFNWTQNTAIYTGVKTMTDNLQIQTPAIAILIVYWFILTIIYIIIDIVLKCFTTITHMIFRAD